MRLKEKLRQWGNNMKRGIKKGWNYLTAHKEQIKQGAQRANQYADTAIKKAQEIGSAVGGKYGNQISEKARQAESLKRQAEEKARQVADKAKKVAGVIRR